ncbi:MAG TPA: ABC transporter ATP-binding protein [Rhodanobacter sp.]|jgi:lipopolysaccharide transport system ATP-binding protein|nr:ABC transporter ATP-binding protein [Rhodanobacter sp.]
MSSEPLTIEVDALGKKYDIYAQPTDRLKQMIVPRLSRMVGREGKAYYDEFWALRDVTFNVHRGETIGVIGRNGSGKSTLLQMICGTLHPTMGSVKTHGRIAALLELGAGFNPDFTGRENVYLSGLLYGISETELRRRFDSILDFADIGDFINQPVKTYSSGMYVRLAFAVAAHVDADTLLIDEALSVGDILFTQKCMRFLRDFQQRGTLLFVSHDTSAVTSMCTRAVWLDGGQLVMDGTAKQVVESYLATQHAVDRARSGESVLLHNRNRTRPNDGMHAADTAGVSESIPLDVIDKRMEVLNGTASRNLIEVFEFDPELAGSQFGAGALRIEGVSLTDDEGNPRKLMAGGEAVDLVVEAEAVLAVDSIIMGFHVKNRLGQLLFGDNTYLVYRDRPVGVAKGSRLRAHFRFRMPILPSGDYSVDAAVATGSQENHTQQHWVHDALTFRSTQSTLSRGLVGIPMHEIRIEIGTSES